MLLRVVNMRIKDGLTPDQICFISFTRRAANEAKWRMMDIHKFQEEQLPWFRTLHSMAFQQLGMNKSNVMGLGDYIKLCDMLGLRITYKTLADDGTFAGQTLGDRLFFMENMARARMMPLKEFWESMPNEDIYWYHLEQVAKTLKEYKESTGKYDFTDIIHMWVANGDPPPCQVLVVDEAQDLSPLQWKMVEKLIDKIPECYVAGDDDQAIFRWAGADVEHLMNLPGRQEILGVSFRVPRHVQIIANEIASRIQHRIKKEWDARDHDGVVERVNSIEDIDMSTGRWLLLARNAYLLDHYIRHCMQEGYVFDCAKESPLRRDSYMAIQNWEALRSGSQVPAMHVKLIYSLMTVRVGVTYGFKGKVDDLPDRKLLTMDELRNNFGLCTQKPWHEALDKLAPEEVTYFTAAVARGEKLSGDPRIRISTIHGAKGAEADNVVILTDMAARTWNEFEKMPDDEHRVWYVAVTRAKERLMIVSPSTNMAYDI
jgi:superfamily I DNA/RNA helicase